MRPHVPKEHHHHREGDWDQSVDDCSSRRRKSGRILPSDILPKSFSCPRRLKRPQRPAKTYLHNNLCSSTKQPCYLDRESYCLKQINFAKIELFTIFLKHKSNISTAHRRSPSYSHLTVIGSIRVRTLYISFLFISQLIYVAEFISFAFLLTDFVNKLHVLKIKIPEHFAKY